MNNLKFSKLSFIVLIVLIISLFPYQIITATENPLLLLDYEELDDKHFSVDISLGNMNEISIMSIPIGFNPENVAVCGYDASNGNYFDIEDGVATSDEINSGEKGLVFTDTLFADNKWNGMMIYNANYPYISNRDGLIKMALYCMDPSYDFGSKNKIFTIYFKRLNNKPADIRIANKYNSEVYDIASTSGAIFLTLAGELDVTYQMNGDIFLKNNGDNKVPDTDNKSDNVPVTNTPSGGSSGSGSVTTSGSEEQTAIYSTVFEDVTKNDWYYEHVYELAERKIINGYGNGTFNPDGYITRAELTKIVVSALGLDLSDNTELFVDSKTTDWYNQYLVTAYENNIILGYPDKSFKPNDYITREDLCLIVSKAFLNGTSIDSDYKITFSDKDLISDYALDAISKINCSGIVNGRGSNMFAPKDNATRAETAKIVYLCLKNNQFNK